MPNIPCEKQETRFIWGKSKGSFEKVLHFLRPLV